MTYVYITLKYDVNPMTKSLYMCGSFDYLKMYWLKFDIWYRILCNPNREHFCRDHDVYSKNILLIRHKHMTKYCYRKKKDAGYECPNSYTGPIVFCTIYDSIVLPTVINLTQWAINHNLMLLITLLHFIPTNLFSLTKWLFSTHT